MAYTDKIFKLCNLDEISSRIVKISAPYVLSLLTYIFNKVLSTGIFPERLQFSEVRPLFKKGDITEFSNYRPISLLTSFSKIIEKIIYKRFYNYLNDNNILVGDQYGFREKLSTETAIYTFLNNVLSLFDRRNLVGGLCCDLQKAFDCVNHEMLLAKMKFYGISRIANKLMESCLENRYHRVSVNNSIPNKLSSKWVHVKHGVRSINKLVNPILFADDTTIIISNTNPEEFKNNINSVMIEITNWFQSNLLITLNCNKTHFTQFLTKKQN